MNYNSGFKYNHYGVERGASYNSAVFRVFVNVYDVLSVYEPEMKSLAKIALLESTKLPDFLKQFVLQDHIDSIYADDNSKNFALFNIMEDLSVSDAFFEIIVALELFDKQSALDEIRQLNAVIEHSEMASLNDKSTLYALMDIAECFNLNEAKSILALLSKFEIAGFSDKTPKKAISDFLIGQIDGKDSAYDWIIPFDMKVDWKNTSIQVMPQAESSYIEMFGVDGSIVENTVYKNRLFSIVAFSEQGLNVYEKEQIKRDIVQVLDSTKHNPKKLTLQASGTSFDVKYSGTAEISEGPSYVKATIPFETSPYGYPLFEQESFGTGLLVNNGDAASGCVHRISSGCVNPRFQLGATEYSWNGTVPQDTTLVIDHNNFTCYLETVKGVRTNVLDKLTGEFQTIPAKTSVAITADKNTAEHLTTTLHEKILW